MKLKLPFMPSKISIHLSVLMVLAILVSGCWPHATRSSLSRGELPLQNFEEVIQVEEMLGLLIVPVTINGKEYRFLYDTGAPLSLSDELQEEFRFKKVSQTVMTDSDGNKKVLPFVRIDSISLGSVPFYNQTAFVGDFKAHPILGCMKLDGIVGSNMMRFCNWTINYQEETITLSRGKPLGDSTKTDTIPFTTDRQFNIRTSWEINGSTVSSLKVDYGSNGGLSLPNSVIDKLIEKQVLDTIYHEYGRKRSGIFGEAKPFEGRLAYPDSVFWKHVFLPHVEIKKSRSGLIGYKILSRYVVSIDWSGRNLLLTPVGQEIKRPGTFGARLGVRDDGQIEVQSVVKESVAGRSGIEPGTLVSRIDTLDFGKDKGYCDYIHWLEGNPQKMDLWLTDENNESYQKVLLKEPLK